MAPVIGRELCDELGAPHGSKTVVRIMRSEAREASVDEQDIAANIRHLVNLNIARDMCRAREITGIVLAGRIQLGGDGRDVTEFPNVDSSADREAAGGDGHAHWFVERAEMCVDDAGIGAKDHQLAGLIRRYEE